MNHRIGVVVKEAWKAVSIHLIQCWQVCKMDVELNLFNADEAVKTMSCSKGTFIFFYFYFFVNELFLEWSWIPYYSNMTSKFKPLFRSDFERGYNYLKC